MSKFLLLLAGKFSAVKAYLKRVIADGGTTSDPAHAQVVYDNTIGDEPTLIQSCDSGKATVLYNIEPTNADFTVDRNSTKYVLGSGGTIISYATDEPAFEFNADGSYKGLLVEPAATNLAFNDNNFNGFSSCTIASVSETNPLGTTTDVFTATFTGTGGFRLNQNITFVSGTTYSMGHFMKFNGQAITLTANGATASIISPSGTFSFDASGQPSSTGDVKYNSYANGWYYVYAVATALLDGATRINWNTSETTSIIIYKSQYETGPIATSYIPTTTASVTRVKDDITLGSASSLIGQTEGTLYVEVDWQLATGTNQDFITVSDGTIGNFFVLTNNPSTLISMVAVANSVVLTNQGVSSSGYSGIQKIAFAYKTNDFELYRNGSSISSDASGSLAALGTLTDIDIGQSLLAGSQVNMHIRAVALYPKRLSDAEAQALTTL
jgi:hypothetical protein